MEILTKLQFFEEIVQRVKQKIVTEKLTALLSLTKPGIILGNVLTAMAGFFIAYKPGDSFFSLFSMLFGLSFIIASACTFNNYIDRELDAKMKRTRNRPLPQGKIVPSVALIWGGFLGLYGTFFLINYTNELTTLVALIGFGVYVFCYSLLKYYSNIATLIGSIAGACPPVVGYVAVKGTLDFTSLLLFLLLVCWQMPHFLAIAIYRKEDYEKGGIPLTPIQKGLFFAQLEMTFYTLGFLLVLGCLWIFDLIGLLYFFLLASLGSYWLYQVLKGFTNKEPILWAKKIFFLSLLVITTLSLLSPLNFLAF